MYLIVRFIRWLKRIKRIHVTNSLRTPRIPETRDMNAPQSREVKSAKNVISVKTEIHKMDSRLRGNDIVDSRVPRFRRDGNDRVCGNGNTRPILPSPKPKLVIAQSEAEARQANAHVTAEPDVVKCIYCAGKEVVKRGKRKKKHETVQLYFCHHCKKTDECPHQFFQDGSRI